MKNLFTIILLSSFGIFFSQEKDILKVLHEQQTAWNNGEIENFMKGYWKDDSLLFIGSKGPTYGWQKTLDNYKKLLTHGANTLVAGNTVFSSQNPTLTIAELKK